MAIDVTVKLVSDYCASMQRRFAVVGGYALIAHNIVRTTFDLDILVEADFQRDLVNFLVDQGYETLYRSSGFSNHAAPTSEHSDLTRLDVIYVDPTTARQVFARCSRRKIGAGIVVDVPCREHLIAMKVRAIDNDPSRQYQDLADLQRLFQDPDLDHVQIRSYFDELGLLPMYEQLKND